MKSVIALPLRGRKGTQGVIEIFNPRGEMSDYSIAFLHILADHAAIAIENARARRRASSNLPSPTTPPGFTTCATCTMCSDTS